MPLRVAYLSHVLVEHDYRFLEALNSKNGLVTILVTLAANVPEEFRKLSKIKIIQIHHPMFPADDPTRSEYGVATRMRLKLGFHWYARKLRKILHHEGISVLHAGWVQVDGLLARLSGFKPLLLMPWGSDILLNPDRSRRTKSLTRSILASSSYVTCDNKTVRDKILEIDPKYPQDHFLVMPWGVDLKKFYPSPMGLTLDPLRLIMTRQFRPVYNIPFFLDVVAQLRRIAPPFEVVMIGQGPEKSAIEEKIKQHHLGDLIQLKGYVPNQELAKELRNASLYVSTSLSDGSSVSLLEAMACGLPCVVSDHPSNRSWVEEEQNGTLVNPRSVSEAVSKIAHLLRDQSNLQKMGAASRKKAEDEADWNKNVERLVNLYSELAIASGRPS